MAPLPNPLPTTSPREIGVAPPAETGLAVPAESGVAPPAEIGGAPPALEIRDLRPADADLLDQLHESLSPRSRYQRYHAAKPRLSSRERAFLAGADGHDHVALVAIEDGAPVAVARYVRDRRQPGTADIAAEVVDRRQRQGLGSDLVARLARRAAHAGIERLTATVLSQTGLRAVLTRRGWRVRSFDGPTTTLEADVWTLLRR